MTKTEKAALSETLCNMTYEMTGKVRQTKDKLVYRMRDLAEKLARIADRLEQSEIGQRGTINSLGEVQFAGAEIDRLCGVYDAQLEAREVASFYIGQVTK